ncbi:PREDICTED: uncharacterized protein LOC108558192 [Nicrophorus vespilloides]|uniref:Uncharacterized protein LOC108558192 n=1 Tax=Nicrophorus vespilloides TaxID=110193 RepID=A0ABM1M7G4_NICVS|nr:PREDICTED: uncharacterized protein LOC108558192 [Nicrophorus vespilloides]
MDVTSSIGDAAYDVPWYSKDQTKLRKSLSLIILRSQRTDKLTIGDMVDLNLVTYLSIVKNSLSICTLVQTIPD